VDNVAGEIPDLVRSFGTELVDNGFTALTPWISESFGEMTVGYEKGALRLQIGYDRNGFWYLQIAAPSGRWYDPDIWCAALDGEEAPFDPSDLSEQIRVVRERLPDFSTNVSGDLSERLERTAMDRLNRRIRPPTPW
jgi:hypothetical protein